MSKKVEAGEIYHCDKSGVVVVILRGGNAIPSTEHGEMMKKTVEVSSETLDVLDINPADLHNVAAKDSPDRV